jgi:hypothetical protein
MDTIDSSDFSDNDVTTSDLVLDEFEDDFDFNDEQISTDNSASNSFDNSDSVSDYVDGKICLICDVEFQSPIIAIKHAKTNHLDIINPVSLHIHSKLLYLSPDMSYVYDFPLSSLAKGSNSLCFDHKYHLSLFEV